MNADKNVVVDNKMSKSKKKAAQNCVVNTDFEQHKNYITNLLKSKKLDCFKFDPCYFETMGNMWLIEKYIAKYGVIKEDAPENTLPAFTEAINLGYSILISVQMLHDDTLVCYKNKSLAKLNNENGYVANTTLEEIKALRYNNSTESVPTLAEALDHIGGKTPVIIELLNETAVGKCEELLVKTLNDYSVKFNCFHSIAIMAINPYSLEWLYRNAPWYTRIVKSCSFPNTKIYANIKTKRLKKLKFHKIAHADFVSYNSKELPNRYIKKCKPVGVLAYNVTTQEEYEKVIKHSDNIIFSGFDPHI